MNRRSIGAWLLGVWLATWACADVLPDLLKGRIEDQYGVVGAQRLARWEQLIWDLRYQTDHVKVSAVNQYFNAMDFVTDQVHWQQEDYWATPLETLATNGGDCEDFAIAKYFTLRELGVEAEQLRITYVRAITIQEPHMVLTYYPASGEPLVLDILKTELLPVSKRLDLAPVYSFNGDGLWKSKPEGGETRLGSSESIALWREMQLRLGLGKLK